MVNDDSRKCITILSNNLGTGGALACVSLARALKPHFDIQLIGAQYGPNPWPGLHDVDIPVSIYPGSPLPGFLKTMGRIRSSIRGDIVIAHQFRMPSFGIGLLHKNLTGVPCAVYIDDDDIALTMPGRSNRFRDRLRASNGDLPTRLMYRMRRRADATFCGSDYFSAMLDGVTVPLGRDETLYDPDKHDKQELRRDLGIEDHQTVIGFMGNPRPHVGIEDLVRALETIKGDDCVLLVAPPGEVSDFARELFSASTATIKVLDNQPSKEIPALLAASDLVVVPQRNEKISLGQLPARLVEAMAMAKPIVATNVANMPEWLQDSGIIVDERAPDQLADAINWIREHPEKAADMGRAARRTFQEKLSLNAMAGKLVPFLEKILARTEKQRQ